MARVEVITGPERRRRWTEEQKRAIVAASLEPGAVVADVARRAVIGADQIYRWRQQFTRGGSFAQVLIAPPEATSPNGARNAMCAEPVVEIEFAGNARAYPGLDPGAVGGVDRQGIGAAMIPVPSGVRVWLAVGHTDMRRGMNSLAIQVQQILKRDPHAGDLYVFRGKRGQLIKILWHDGIGMSLYAKRLERGRFIWPSPADGTVAITAAQLTYMLDGIDWRNPVLSWRPQAAG
jgi:transposase